MITVNEIQQAEGDVLSRMLGEVLREGPYRHTVNVLNTCTKCEFNFIFPSTEQDVLCPIADPIPLNWDNAMKWRVLSCDTYGETLFDNAKCFAMRLWGKTIPRSTKHKIEGWRIADSYFANSATPIDYLRASAICKIQAKP